MEATATQEPTADGPVRDVAAQDPEPRDLPDRLGDTLRAIWSRQLDFNRAVAARDGVALTERDSWVSTYLLGLASEMQDVQRVTQWKRHRSQQPPPLDRYQLSLELADLTKYVFSLWLLWDYTPEQMLTAVRHKGELVEQRFLSEFTQPEPGQPVIIADVDNTLLDFHETFASWLWKHHHELCGAEQPTFQSLQGDLDLQLPWTQYRELKHEFESSGGYGPEYAIPERDAGRFLRIAKERGWFVSLFTARPEREYSRIWLDTWQSLKQGLSFEPHQLRFGEGERLIYAKFLADRGHRVLYLEDNPDLARRAARMGIRTVVRRWPYNTALEDELDALPTLGLTLRFDTDLLAEKEPVC